MDMVRPASKDNKSRFTLDDLINCGQGHTVVGILTDVNAFWLYENRENLMHTPVEDDEAEDQEPQGQAGSGHGGGAIEVEVELEEEDDGTGFISV